MFFVVIYGNMNFFLEKKVKKVFSENFHFCCALQRYEATNAITKLLNDLFKSSICNSVWYPPLPAHFNNLNFKNIYERNFK